MNWMSLHGSPIFVDYVSRYQRCVRFGDHQMIRWLFLVDGGLVLPIDVVVGYPY